MWRGLRWLPHDLVDQVDPIMQRCLKLKHRLGTVTKLYRVMCKGKQQKSMQLKITSFFTSSSFPPSPCTQHFSTTMTTLSQEHQHLSSTNVFVFNNHLFTYYHVLCVFDHPDCIFSHEPLTLCIVVSVFIGLLKNVNFLQWWGFAVKSAYSLMLTLKYVCTHCIMGMC